MIKGQEKEHLQTSNLWKILLVLTPDAVGILIYDVYASKEILNPTSKHKFLEKKLKLLLKAFCGPKNHNNGNNEQKEKFEGKLGVKGVEIN